MKQGACILLSLFLAVSALSPISPCLAERLEVIRADAVPPAAPTPEPSPPKPAQPSAPPTPVSAPEPRKPARDLTFHLTDDQGRAVAWTLQGPREAEAAARSWREGGHGPGDGPTALTSPDGAFLFRLDERNRLLVRDLKTGREAAAEPPANFPRTLPQVDGMAFDSRRRILTLTAADGAGGRLYRFDAGAGKWLDCRFLGLPRHPIAPVYDPAADRYAAWAGNGELLFISPEGERLFGRRIADKLPGFELLPLLRENAYALRDPVAVFPRGDDIVLVAFDDRRRVPAIWVYNLKSDRAELT